MGIRLSLILFVLALGALSVWGFSSPSEPVHSRFEAHEFAVFRSEYDSLKVQSPVKRAEHFRALLETTESSKLTPAMTETLASFCHTVATSEEEAGVVKEEATLVARALENRLPTRAPASIEKAAHSR